MHGKGAGTMEEKPTFVLITGKNTWRQDIIIERITAKIKALGVKVVNIGMVDPVPRQELDHAIGVVKKEIAMRHVVFRNNEEKKTFKVKEMETVKKVLERTRAKYDQLELIDKGTRSDMSNMREEKIGPQPPHNK